MWLNCPIFRNGRLRCFLFPLLSHCNDSSYNCLLCLGILGILCHQERFVSKDTFTNSPMLSLHSPKAVHTAENLCTIECKTTLYKQYQNKRKTPAKYYTNLVCMCLSVLSMQNMLVRKFFLYITMGIIYGSRSLAIYFRLILTGNSSRVWRITEFYIRTCVGLKDRCPSILNQWHQKRVMNHLD